MSLAPYTCLHEAPEAVQLDFRFQCQAPGNNDPDFQFPAGAVLDVVRNGVGTGLYNITLKNKWPQLLTCVVVVAPASVGATGQAGQFVSYTASTGVLQVRAVDFDAAGAPAAADPPDDSWIHVRAVFCRRTALMAVGAV